MVNSAARRFMISGSTRLDGAGTAEAGPQPLGGVRASASDARIAAGMRVCSYLPPDPPEEAPPTGLNTGSSCCGLTVSADSGAFFFGTCGEYAGWLVFGTKVGTACACAELAGAAPGKSPLAVDTTLLPASLWLPMLLGGRQPTNPSERGCGCHSGGTIGAERGG